MVASLPVDLHARRHGRNAKGIGLEDEIKEWTNGSSMSENRTMKVDRLWFVIVVYS